MISSLNFHGFLQSTLFQFLKSLECIYSAHLYEIAVSLPSLLGVNQVWPPGQELPWWVVETHSLWEWFH